MKSIEDLQLPPSTTRTGDGERVHRGVVSPEIARAAGCPASSILGNEQVRCN
jgi:hypothetical protein